jgi:hypothetical protein
MKLLAGTIFLAVSLNAADDAALQSAFEAHRWFDLRDAVVASNAQPWYRLVVDAAFDDLRGTESEWKKLGPARTPKERLADTHYAMYRLYLRLGRYRQAVAELPKMAAADPSRALSAHETAQAEALGRLPDLKVASSKPATIPTTFWEGSKTIVIAVTINELPMKLGIDIAAGMCGVTQAEAKRLGLKMIGGDTEYGGAGGNLAQVRYAVAEHMRVGNTALRDVAFVIGSDANFSMLPLGERGVLGIPAAIAVGTFRWEHNRELTLGFPAERFDLGSANLAYDADYPITSAEIDVRKANLGVDSGGKETLLFPPFFDKFPEHIEKAHKGAAHWFGLDGEVTRDAMLVPELRFNLGTFPILLHESPALLSATIPQSERYEGQLGMDAMAQAAELTFDLRAMKMTLK